MGSLADGRGETARRDALIAGFDNVTLEDVRGRGNAKWSRYGPDVLAAWVAEMDFPLAAKIRGALHEAIERGCTGYPPQPEETGLPRACADWLARGGLSVDPGQIRIVLDVLQGIILAIELYSRPGSAVVVMTPSYPPFFETVGVAGRKIVETPLSVSGQRPAFDLDAIYAALRAGAGTVILCNPYNPLGRVFRREELAALAEIVEAQGARVIADEVHAPLVYPGAIHVPYASVSAAAAAHSVTLTSASKGWNLPGLRCAQIVLTNEADIAPWDRLSHLRSGGASILGILANRVAYAEGQPWLDVVIGYLDGNRTLLADLLAAHLPRVGYTMPEATYLAWLDCRALGLEDPAAFFLKHAKVAVRDGAGFGEPGRGWVRLTFATSRSILTRMIEQMGDALRARD